MRLVGLMPVRNEDWCLGLTLRVALEWCDEVVVLLHACTDRSEAIAYSLANATGRVTVMEEESDLWDEMNHRQAMLLMARMGERPGAPAGPSGTHIALIDADEMLTANLRENVRGWVERLNARDLVQRRLELPLYNMREDPERHAAAYPRYHANGIWGNRVTTVAFEDSPKLGWAGDFHHHREPMGAEPRGLLARGAGPRWRAPPVGSE